MSIGGWFKGMLARVFGGNQVGRSDMPANIVESGVDFNYPVIFVPGPPNHNALRNRSVNDAALPFTPEEYKKIKNEIDARQDLNPLMKQEMLKEVIKHNPKWVPEVNTKPKEELKPSSSAIRSLRITPENKIEIQFANNPKKYTYTGGNTVREAAKSVLDLINSPSIGQALNRKTGGSWAQRHYDASAVG